MRRFPLKRALEWARFLRANHKAGEACYPFYASFKITHRCHFRCRFCNVWMEKTRDVSTEEAFRILDNLGTSSVFLLTIEGGEPLLREDLGEILRVAYTKPFYILMVTSAHDLTEYPMREYCRTIDFLHISIDEGHDNLELLDGLETFRTWGSDVCVQIVVRAQDLEKLEDKVTRCCEAGVKALVMPAVHLDHTRNYFPETRMFVRTCAELKRRYPWTVITPMGYLERIQRAHGCSASSIIVDSDGGLFYPCRTLGKKPVNLLDTQLMDFIASQDAAALREVMAHCDRRCGWYQYFATDSFASFREAGSAIHPYLKNVLR